MVHPAAEGPSAIPPNQRLGDTPPAIVGEYWTTEGLWSAINMASYANTPQYLSTMAAAIAAFVNYAKTNPPTDAAGQSILADLNQPIYYGATDTLASLCTAVPPKLTTLSAFFPNIETILGSQGSNTGLCSHVNNFFNWFYGTYPHPPKSMPSHLDFHFECLTNALSHLDQWRGQTTSTEYQDWLNQAATELTALHSDLTGGTLDAYGQFLLNFITAPLDASGDTLYSLATSNVAQLGVWLENPPAPPIPYTGPQVSFSSQLQGWVANIMSGSEFPS